jgi:hypothetical protein
VVGRSGTEEAAHATFVELGQSATTPSTARGKGRQLFGTQIPGICNSDEVTPELQLAGLHYVDVRVKGIDTLIHALIDSGSQVCVINAKLLAGLHLISVGNLHLRGITGSAIRCDLYKLHASLAEAGEDREHK